MGVIFRSCEQMELKMSFNGAEGIRPLHIAMSERGPEELHVEFVHWIPFGIDLARFLFIHRFTFAQIV